jgi:DNA-binding MarR family transcriptional regulator
VASRSESIAICLHTERNWDILGRMANTSFSAVINLLRACAQLEERFANELAGIHGLALKEVLLLMHLERAPRARLTRVDLAKRLHVSPSTVTRMTIPLEKVSIVGREADDRDARLAYVVLTDSGRKLVLTARATLERMSVEVFRDRWTKHEITSLADLLGRIIAGQPGNLA